MIWGDKIGGKTLKVVTKEGCNVCAKVESFFDDEAVIKALKEEGVDEIKLVDQSHEEADEIYRKFAEYGKGRQGKLIEAGMKPTPITVVEDGNDIKKMTMGFSKDYGVELAEAIDAEQNALDKFKKVRRAISRIGGLFR